MGSTVDAPEPGFKRLTFVVYDIQNGLEVSREIDIELHGDHVVLSCTPAGLEVVHLHPGVIEVRPA